MRKGKRNLALLVARKEAGMTQGELAAAVGRSRFWINKIENDLEKPSQELAKEIAKAVGKSPEELFGGKYKKVDGS